MAGGDSRGRGTGDPTTTVPLPNLRGFDGDGGNGGHTDPGALAGLAPDQITELVKEARIAASRAAKFRQIAGYVLMGLALCYMLGVAAWAAWSLTDPVPFVGGWEHLYLAIAQMIVHIAVVLGLVWFGYQLLRIGERLAIPLWIVQDVRDVLGVEAPQERALQAVRKEMLDLMRAVDGMKGGDKKDE